MGTYPKNIIRTSDITVLYSLFDERGVRPLQRFSEAKDDVAVYILTTM